MPNWRDTYKPARFFMVDARIAPALLITLVWVRWYTVIPTIILIGLVWYAEKRLDMDVASALRSVRSWFAGSDRPARSVLKQRSVVDYDRSNRPFSE
jgi:hypothetical protein